MGYGDELIVTSIVKKAKLKHPERNIVVGDGHNAYWSEVFENNPKISKQITKNTIWVRNITGNRPYIDYQNSKPNKVVWKDYKVEPGELFFSPEELRHTESDFVYIEPNVKGTVYKNKDWGFDNWQKVVDSLPGVKFIQGRGRKLENVLQVDTTSFRDACALLSRAFLFVGTDGGLHHAAAALNKPAVVIFSGLISPKIIGYESHVNLCEAKNFCGSLLECPHCKESLKKITPEMVVTEIKKICESN